jgi:hypothetical protein
LPKPIVGLQQRKPKPIAGPPKRIVEPPKPIIGLPG